MKVFLMYPDRDFAPQQEPLSNAAALTQDLELNTLFEAMAQEDKLLFEVAQQAVLSSLDAPDAIRYRQAILKDCLAYPDVVRQIYSLSIQSIENKQRRWLGIFGRYPSAVLGGALELLAMFVGLLKSLKKIADLHAPHFESRGFRRFFAMVQQELDDDYFGVVENHLKTLKFRGGVLLSAELGTGNEGSNYVLCKPNQRDPRWIKRVFARKPPTYSFTLSPRDDNGARALADLKDRGINRVANAVAQSAEHIDSFFSALRLELSFYVGCLNLSEQLAPLGGPISFPQPVAPDERRHAFRGLYDVSLALTLKRNVVGNDVNADHKDLVLITGANQGGKSTFLRSVGLAQLMMQCGLFVTAEFFCANTCKGLFTHYKREEDATMNSGKFDEELSRMSAIVDNLTPGSMVLFNESFAATNEREGSEIARQIVSALLEQHVKVFFVTHLYELAFNFYVKKTEKTLFLRAERHSDSRRTFKLSEGKPLQTSYGVYLYNAVFETDPV